jgi:hypothetical protein
LGKRRITVRDKARIPGDFFSGDPFCNRFTLPECDHVDHGAVLVFDVWILLFSLRPEVGGAAAVQRVEKEEGLVDRLAERVAQIGVLDPGTAAAGAAGQIAAASRSRARMRFQTGGFFMNITLFSSFLCAT